MISTFMVDATDALAPVRSVAIAVLAAGGGEARVLVHSIEEEAMRYLYVASLARGGILLTLSGLFAFVAVAVAVKRAFDAPAVRHPERRCMSPRGRTATTWQAALYLAVLATLCSGDRRSSETRCRTSLTRSTFARVPHPSSA